MRTLILFLLLGSTISYSQIPSLEKYIQKLSEQYSCTFSYDNDLVAGAPFLADTNATSLESYLSWMEANSAFRFTLSKGNLVLVEPKVPGANTIIRINALSETGERINELSLRSNKGTIKQQNYDGKTLTAYLNYSPNDTVNLVAELYASQKLAVDDLLKKNNNTTRLKEDIKLLNEVVVSSYMTTGVNYKKQNQAIEVDLESLPALPGQTDGDILNALEALPGIASPDGRAGSLNIRGSTSDQTYLMYDNIPIYHKGHYFGTLSPYNPLSVDKVNVSRSAFSADKGGRVGGAIEIISRKNYKDSTSFDLNLSTTYAGACLRLPIVKRKLGIMIAARSSYPFDYQTPKMKAITKFIYQESEVNRAMNDTAFDLKHYLYGFNDINIKIGGDITSKTNWQLSFLSINNHVRISALDKKTKVIANDNMLLYNNGFNLSLNHKWSNVVQTSISLTNSYFTQKFHSDEIFEPKDSMRFNAHFTNRLTDHSLKVETEWKTSRRVSFLLGYDAKKHEVLNEAYHSSASVKDSTDVTRLFVHAGYLNINYNIRNKLYSTLGIRGIYNSYTQLWYAEPRASLSYIANKVILFKTAAGLFNQFLVQVPGISIETVGGLENANWIAADGNAIPVITGKQFSAGTVVTPGKGFIIDVEGYLKKIDNTTVNNFVNFKSPNRYISGHTETIGVDILLKKKFGALETWASYSLSKSTMHFDSLSKTEDYDWIWNQTHVVDLAAIYSIKNFRFSAIWKFRSGLSALPGIRIKMLAGPPSGGLTSGNQPPPPPPPPGNTTQPNPDEYRDLYPNFHQLDLSAVYMIPSKKKWKASIGASVNNVYDQKNIVVQMKRPNTNPSMFVFKYTQGFSPNIQFNLSY